MYTFKTALHSRPFDTNWDDAQNWCNYVLFQPTWLPKGLKEIDNKIRPESPEEPCSHRAQFQDSTRALSIKQFLYDWAPPAYDHPCLWRNPKISSAEDTPLPKPYLIGNNYLWFGLDYRRKSAATINRMRTQIEITILEGVFNEQEIIDIVKGLTPVDSKAKDAILATSFARLMWDYRHKSKAIPVPTSYFSHKRTEDMKCYPYPYPLKATGLNANLLIGNWLLNAPIDGYRLDSILLLGQNAEDIQEVQYYFESLIEPGSYIYFLATKEDAKYKIQYPPVLSDQECNYAVHKLENGEPLYHAWSKTNDNGSHTLVFKNSDSIINCIIKPAPWTKLHWAKEFCSRIHSHRLLK